MGVRDNDNRTKLVPRNLVVINDKPLLAPNIGKCYNDNNNDNNSVTLSITGVNPIYTN